MPLTNQKVSLFFTPTCEEAAVVLLYFLRRLKLLLGMFLREFVAQVLRVPLLSVETVRQQDLDSFHHLFHLSWSQHLTLALTLRWIENG